LPRKACAAGRDDKGRAYQPTSAHNPAMSEEVRTCLFIQPDAFKLDLSSSLADERTLDPLRVEAAFLDESAERTTEKEREEPALDLHGE
jgi:hypothetical protein